MTKVVILAGGRGSRLQELTGEVPKPMLLVGDVPMLMHIIYGFIGAGFRDFIIPVGYLGDKIKSYFRNNFTHVEEHSDVLCVKSDLCNFTIVDTGINTLTGGRLLRLKKYLTEPFMMTYGDGLCNINPKFVKELGEELDKNIVTVVHPAPRFGSVSLAPTGEVMSFSEKSINPHEWINGGFMYLKPTVLNYIRDDNCNLEKDVMPKLVWDSSLWAFQYAGVFHPVDTVKDLEIANELYKSGELKW